MDGVRQRVRHHEQQKFDKEVNEQFEQIKFEMDSIEICMEPNDIEITSEKQGFWEHDVINLSPFQVVVRVRATSSYLFTVDCNAFRIGPNQAFTFRITRAEHRIRSHHIKLDVTKYSETYNPRNLLNYFIGPYPFKTFVIRYHGAPRYWQDALELNDWCPDEELTAILDQEMKRTSREWKSSQEETEKDGSASKSGGAVEQEEPVIKNTANVNMANVMLMAMQDLGEEVDGAETDDFEDDAAEFDLIRDATGALQMLMLSPANHPE